MTTLTMLEDCLRDSNAQAEAWLVTLAQARARLELAMMSPTSRDEYKDLTVLRDAVIQAEDIINVIYYRYHNTSIITSGYG